MKQINLIILFTLLTQGVFATFEFNARCNEAYEAIINLNFKRGKEILETEKKENPKNLIPYHIENYIDFLTIIISEDHAVFDEREPNKDKRLDILKNGDDTSPYFLYSRADIYLQWAFSRLKFKEYVSAAYEIHKAYKLLEKNTRLFPDFVPNKKGLGLLHALIGTIPDEYSWAKKIVGMNGSISGGVNELMEVLELSIDKEEYDYLKTETFFLLSFVQLNLQIEGDADQSILLKYATTLFDENEAKSNVLFNFSRARIAIKFGKNEEAINYLKMRPQGKNHYPLHYLDYLLGVAMQGKLDTVAESYFKKYVNNFDGQNYIKSAYRRMAWVRLLNGDNDGYWEYMSKIPPVGHEVVGADKEAEKAAQTKEIPNLKLLKARLLFDGGYYSKARLALVEGGSANTFKLPAEQVEFVYRLGRIYHKMDKWEKALSYYSLTIEKGTELPKYYAANAALQSGMIHESTGDLVKAKASFELCLSLKNHQYYQSLSQKAKAGLHRLKANKK